MRAFPSRARTALPRWYFVPSPLLIALLIPALLYAQDSAAAAPDHTGIFGPVIDKFWPVIVTFLTSLIVKGIALVNQGFAKTGPLVKWAALYFFALAFNQLAGWLHITALDPLAPVLGLSLVQTVAAGLVYKFGQHTVPAAPASSAQPYRSHLG